MRSVCVRPETKNIRFVRTPPGLHWALKADARLSSANRLADGFSSTAIRAGNIASTYSGRGASAEIVRVKSVPAVPLLRHEFPTDSVRKYLLWAARGMRNGGNVTSRKAAMSDVCISSNEKEISHARVL